LPQHEIAIDRDLVVCAYQEATVEDDVNLVYEAEAMRAGIKEKSLDLRQKQGKLTAIANPKLGDHFLAQVIIILSFLFKINLNEMILMTCLYSFSFIETNGEIQCH
jgi:hypothetical protein